VNGQVTAANTWQKVYDADVAVTQAAPVAFAIPVSGLYKIFYRGVLTTSADSRLLLRFGNSVSSISSPYRSYLSMEGGASITESDLTGIYLNRSSSNRIAFLSGETTVTVINFGSNITGVITRGEGISWDYSQTTTTVIGIRNEGALENAISGGVHAMQLAVTAANSRWDGRLIIYAIPSTP
jgi:hypothetical protein